MKSEKDLKDKHTDRQQIGRVPRKGTQTAPSVSDKARSFKIKAIISKKGDNLKVEQRYI